MLALPDIGIEVIFLIVAGIIAGISRIVEWSQRVRRRSVAEQEERVQQGGFAVAGPEEKKAAAPRRERSREKPIQVVDVLDQFLSTRRSAGRPPNLFDVVDDAARTEPKAPEKRPARRPQPAPRLDLGTPVRAAAVPVARKPAPRSGLKPIAPGNYALKKHRNPRTSSLPLDIRRAIIAREVLGPPKAAQYLRGIRLRRA